MSCPTAFWPILPRFVLRRGALIAGLALSPSIAWAQAQGPTLMDWINGRRQPAPPTTAQQGAPRPATAAPPGAAAATPPATVPPATAPASQSRGWYMRADVNLGLYQSSSQTNANCGTTALIELCGYSANGNTADVLGLTVGGGYRWTPWLRTDATYSYRASAQAAGGIGSVGGSPSAGAALASPRANTFFFNAQLDVVPIFGGETGWFQPYIGAGFGPSINTSRDVPITGTLPVGFSALTLPSHTRTTFAWNAGAGVAIRLTSDFALDFGYRYVDLGTFRTGSGVTGSPPATVQPLSWTMQQHELYAGFRLTFGEVPPPPPPVQPAPPAPPPPPPAARPAQQAFLVFFDFNRSNLRPDAMATIQQAAQVIMAGGSARMTLVTGHTDTVGSVQYNIGLSQRRADTVRGQLVQLGVPANVITTRAMGKSQLLVPTPDQTREAQNRRAEIVVQ